MIKKENPKAQAGKDLIAKYHKAIKEKDFITFCSFVQIYVDSDNPEMFFRYENWNEAQKSFERDRCGKDCVLKARRIGFTTLEYVRDLFFALTHAHADVVIVGHEDKFAQKCINQIQKYIDGLNNLGQKLGGVNLVPKPEINNSNIIQFKNPLQGGNGSIITSVNSKSEKKAAEKVFRGDKIDRLHATEIAYWDFAAETFNSIRHSAKKAKEIVYESTANGNTGVFFNHYNAVMMGKQSGWKNHFFPWYIFPENSMEFVSMDDKLKFDYTSRNPYEHKMIHELNITKEQLYWWRYMVTESETGGEGLNQVLQEYPIDVESCFRGKSSTFLDPEDFVWLKENWREPLEKEIIDPIIGTEMFIYERPTVDGYYILGADIAWGKGATNKNADNSTIYVINKYDGTIAARVMSNLYTPTQFAQIIKLVGMIYNDALVAIEQEGLGRNTSEALISLKYKQIYRSEKSGDYGWNSNSNTKIMAASLLKEFVKTKSPLIYDKELIKEISDLVLKDNKLDHTKNSHNDLYTAYTIAQMVRKERAVGQSNFFSSGGQRSQLGQSDYGHHSARISIR